MTGVPDYVERARDADERERNIASDAWYAKQDAKPLNVTPLRPAWLDAVTTLGRADFCPRCGFFVPVADWAPDGSACRECCGLVWTDDE